MEKQDNYITCERMYHLLLPLMDKKDLFSITSYNEDGKIFFLIKASSEDVTKIVGDNGSLFKAIKTLLSMSLRTLSVNLTIDINTIPVDKPY